MDSKDFQLLAALHRDARQSYQSLGRVLGLSAPAVRERVKRLEKTGIMEGYGLWIDPSIFGRQEILVFFARERTRSEAQRTLSFGDVAWVGWKVEGGLTVGMWSPDTDRSVEALGNFLQESPFGQALTAQTNYRRPSNLDWLIIDSMIDNPTIKFGDLVRATGLSPKTVRKHMVELFDSEVLVIVPREGAIAGSGMLVYQMAVAGSTSLSMIRKVMADAILLHQTRSPPMKYLLCRSTDLADVSEKTRELRKLSGISSVSMSLNRELMFSAGLAHSLVRQQMSQGR